MENSRGSSDNWVKQSNPHHVTFLCDDEFTRATVEALSKEPCPSQSFEWLMLDSSALADGTGIVCPTVFLVSADLPDLADALQRVSSYCEHSEIVLVSRGSSREVASLASQYRLGAYLAGDDLNAEAVCFVLGRIIERQSHQLASRQRDSLMTHAVDALLIVDLKTLRILEANPRVCEQLGWQYDELQGTSVKLLLSEGHPLEPGSIVRHDGGILYDQSFACADGSVCLMDVVVSSYPWQDGRVLLMCLRPVSERLQTEQSLKSLNLELEAEVARRTEDLRRDRERWKLAISHTSDGVWDWDMKTGGILCSTTCASILGTTTDALPKTYQQFLTFMHEDDRVRLECVLSDYLSGERESFRADVRIECGDNIFRWVLIRGGLVRDGEGHPIRMLGTLHDIDARKQLEEDLLQNLKRERELREMKSMFVGLVSHEFRTPLAAIQGAADLLANYSDRMSNEDKLECCKDQIAAVKRMTRMLDEFRFMSQVEAGKIHCQPDGLSPFKLAAHIARQQEEQYAREGDIDIVADEHLFCYLDQRLVSNIIECLFSNALKFSPEQSKVTVSLDERDGDFIIEVADKGPGISEVHHQRIFEPFYRVDADSATPGRGLGLYLARLCAELHGGVLSVQSSPAQGTIFTAALPVCTQQ